MNEIRKQFRAPWDILLIIMTILFVGLLLGLNYLYPSESIIPIIIGWSIILICAAFGVYGYSIQNGMLRILRLGWSKDILLSDIKSVEYKPNAMMGSLRTWGIGGVFGYIGYFKNRILSNYKAYATHSRKTVVISTKKNDQIVITPDDPELFVQALLDEIDSSSITSKSTGRVYG
jgi:hypothetical protein